MTDKPDSQPLDVQVVCRDRVDSTRHTELLWLLKRVLDKRRQKASNER